MRPNLLRVAFARDIEHWLSMSGLGRRSAPLKHPMLNPAMISRACSGHVLSPESFLALCLAARLDPFDYLERDQNQTVTAIDKRETATTGRG